MVWSMITPVTLVAFAALVIVLIAVAAKSNLSEGGNAMIKNVYIYLVLFATLMMTIGGSVAAFMAVADIVSPIPYHQSFEEYRQWGIEKVSQPDNGEELSEAEIRARYEDLVFSQKERQIGRAQNNLVKSLGWIVIPLPIFVYYQRCLSKL